MGYKSTILAIFVTFLSTLFLFQSIYPCGVSASPDSISWSEVNIPHEGEEGNWVLAYGSDIRHLTAATDGTLYCYANPAGTGYTLFKSTDNGNSWSATGKVTQAISTIVTAADDSSVVYYATTSSVYKSTDDGKSFIELPPNPGGAGTGNIEITAIDVTRLGTHYIVAVGTRDNDVSQYGGVYILNEDKVGGEWIDTGTGKYDICSVSFSPDFTNDRQLMAIATDETDTIVTSRNGDSSWNQMIDSVTIPGLVPISAAIAFPDDYTIFNGRNSLYLALNTGTGNGDVYKLEMRWLPERSTYTDLNAGLISGTDSIDICSLAITGTANEAHLVAGAANTTGCYISSDGGSSWTKCRCRQYYRMLYQQ